MNILNMVIPILIHFLTFIHKRHSILHQTEPLSATQINYVNQSQVTSLMTSVLRRYIAEYTIQILDVIQSDVTFHSQVH